MTMSLQEMFDKGASHLLKQGEKSERQVREEGSLYCMYRGPGGLMCGAGPFIPDELYTPDMEGMSVRSATSTSDDKYANHPLRHALLALGFGDGERAELLCDLQQIHDNRKVEDWRKCLVNLAARRGLNTDALPAIEE